MKKLILFFAFLFPISQVFSQGRLDRLPSMELFMGSDDVYVAGVNEFNVIPDMNAIMVFFTGTFILPAGFDKEKMRVTIPFPDNFKEPTLHDEHFDVKFDGEVKGFPVYEVPLKKDARAFRLMGFFRLEGSGGIVTWKSTAINEVPGAIAVQINRDQSTVFHNMGEALIGNDFSKDKTAAQPVMSEGGDVKINNNYPPKLVPVSKGLMTRTLEWKHNPRAKQFKRELSANKGKGRRYETAVLARMPNGSKAYPEFLVTGLVPSRTPLNIMAALFAALMLGVVISLVVMRGGSSKSS